MHTHTRSPIAKGLRTKGLLTKGLKLSAALGLALSLSGCIVAMPPAIQFASLALDGVSYMATGKSVTDHAISGVTNKDCAMLRPLQGQDICTDTQPQIAMLPDGTPAPNAIDAAQGVQTAEEDETFQSFAANSESGTATMDLDEILTAEDLQDMELDMQTASGPSDTDF